MIARTFDGVVRGRWLWTGERLLARGGIRIEAGRIAAVLEGDEGDPPRAEAIDLPRGLVHPGLLDAHAHLDLSGLAGAISSTLPFPKWLLTVRDLRKSIGEEGLVEAALAGARTLLASGTTTVVDSSHGGLSECALRESGIRAVLLREVIGPSPSRAAEAGAAAREWLGSRSPDPLISFGLAPHSPYLATGGLIRDCRRSSARRPFSIHAAEHPGEADLLRRGTGEMRDFLLEAGVDLGDFEPPGMGPLEYLDSLGALERALIVHANHLEARDLDLLRARRAAVVFCPRSHRHFSRPPHPLPSLLEAGIPVLLGTDSAASNVGLSVAEEMREVSRAFPALSARTIWGLGTGAGVSAADLGLPSPQGLLAPGLPADVAAAELPDLSGDPLEAFLRESVPCALAMVGGRKMW